MASPAEILGELEQLAPEQQRAVLEIARRLTASSATTPLGARDLWPLVLLLRPEERRRLARLALVASASADTWDATAYRAIPPGPEEFSSEDDALGWEPEGWEGLDAPR